jgi:hypothetical protein
MPEVFDAEMAVKEAIATSPEVTEGVTLDPSGGDISANSSKEKAVKGEIEGIDFQPNKKNGRLLALALEQWDKNKRLDKAQIEAAEELGGEGFGAINAAPIPKGIKLAITSVLLLLGLVPLALDIAGVMGQPKPEEKKEPESPFPKSVTTKKKVKNNVDK